MKFRVTDKDRYVRDGSNFAVLNTDRNALTKHQEKIAKLNQEKARDIEINNIKRDVSEMKDMLRQLLESK